MRTSSLLALLLLSGCGAAEQGESTATNIVAAADPVNRVECALPGEAALKQQCTFEQVKVGEATIVTVRQPNGGFHRFRLLGDGRGVEAADGAERANVTIAGDGVIEVATGGARYRLPARIGPLPKQ